MPSRRDFLGQTAWAGATLGAARLFAWTTGSASAASRLDALARTAPTARFWTSLSKAGANCAACHVATPRAGVQPNHPAGLVQCLLCAQHCAIPAGESGRCRGRINVAGELKSLVYGRPVSVHVDPIEKKPFYHFLPGVTAFSFGTAGCPLSCQFCQNWELSQSAPEDHDVEFLAPARIVDSAAAQSAPVIAFTYNEATVFAEYLLDVARAARPRGVRSVLVSCGFMSEAPLAEMCDVLAAIKIDLKGFSDDFYHRVSGAALAPVLRSIKQIHKRGVHLEIVNLVVPTLNDSEPVLSGLADWLMSELGPEVPIHVTRFHPDAKLLNLPPTPVATLERARDIAMGKGIQYAYVGNVPGHPGNDTYCPQCRQVVIRRAGFFVAENKIANGRCRNCQHKIAGVWS